jgi:hypothetical protein
MLSSDDLCRHPTAFLRLTGLTRTEFDARAERFELAEVELRSTTTTRRDGQSRSRAAGAGRPHRHPACGRLLRARVWLRIYPTDEVLGFFFDRPKRHAQRNVRAALEVLVSRGDRSP